MTDQPSLTTSSARHQRTRDRASCDPRSHLASGDGYGSSQDLALRFFPLEKGAGAEGEGPKKGARMRRGFGRGDGGDGRSFQNFRTPRAEEIAEEPW